MASSALATETQTARVREALENPKCLWRTIPDVTKETNLSVEEVRAALKVLRTEIVQSDIQSSDGEDRFTTRSHYRNKASWYERVLGALKNRAT